MRACNHDDAQAADELGQLRAGSSRDVSTDSRLYVSETFFRFYGDESLKVIDAHFRRPPEASVARKPPGFPV